MEWDGEGRREIKRKLGNYVCEREGERERERSFKMSYYRDCLWCGDVDAWFSFSFSLS